MQLSGTGQNARQDGVLQGRGGQDAVVAIAPRIQRRCMKNHAVLERSQDPQTRRSDPRQQAARPVVPIVEVAGLAQVVKPHHIRFPTGVSAPEKPRPNLLRGSARRCDNGVTARPIARAQPIQCVIHRVAFSRFRHDQSSSRNRLPQEVHRLRLSPPSSRIAPSLRQLQPHIVVGVHDLVVELRALARGKATERSAPAQGNERSSRPPPGRPRIHEQRPRPANTSLHDQGGRNDAGCVQGRKKPLGQSRVHGKQQDDYEAGIHGKERDDQAKRARPSGMRVTTRHDRKRTAKKAQDAQQRRLQPEAKRQPRGVGWAGDLANPIFQVPDARRRQQPPLQRSHHPWPSAFHASPRVREPVH